MHFNCHQNYHEHLFFEASSKSGSKCSKLPVVFRTKSKKSTLFLISAEADQRSIWHWSIGNIQRTSTMTDKQLESHWTFSLQPSKRSKKGYKFSSPHVSVLSSFAASSWKFFKSCKAQKMISCTGVVWCDCMYISIMEIEILHQIGKSFKPHDVKFHISKLETIRGHPCVGHPTWSIIPPSISAMIARNTRRKRPCSHVECASNDSTYQVAEKTTQVFTAQNDHFLISNIYAQMCISSGDLGASYLPLSVISYSSLFMLKMCELLLYHREGPGGQRPVKAPTSGRTSWNPVLKNFTLSTELVLFVSF